MRTATALVCLSVVATVSAVFGALVPAPPGPPAQAVEDAALYRPLTAPWRESERRVRAGRPADEPGWRLWYAHAGAIRLAVSTDGHSFRPAGTALAARPGERLDGPEAAWHAGRWHLWYASEGEGGCGIGHATSRDGRSWRPSPANPLPTLPAALAARPLVERDAAAGCFVMWYRTADAGWRRARSPDGETWEPLPADPAGPDAPAPAELVVAGLRIAAWTAVPPLPAPGARLAAMPAPTAP